MQKNGESKLTKEESAKAPLDLPFLILVLLLVGIGVVMVFSASYASAFYSSASNYNATYYFNRQAIFALAGVAGMYGVSRLNYPKYKRFGFLVFGIAIFLLLLVLVPGLGVSANGATRWLKLKGLPQFQPSEIAKIAIIIYFSARLSDRKDFFIRPKDSRTLGGRTLKAMHDSGFLELLPYGVVLLVVIGLLYLQPHMSATILILVVGASLLFVAGISWGWFLGAGTLVGGLLWFIITNTDYMERRINIWHDPWSDPLGGGFQAIQSLLAIGSGGLLGLGFGNSRQKYLYLPEEHNDFIFSVICEELGFIGAIFILVIFALLIMRGYWIALHAKDRFGTYLVVGVVTLLAFQVFLNVAVVTNFFPVTGISLPFFSYGGSALLIQLAEMGIVLSVSRQIPAKKTG